MSNINELRSKRNQLLSDMQKIALASRVTSEARAQFDRMNMDVTLIDHELADAGVENRSFGGSFPQREQPGAGIEPSHSTDAVARQKKALRAYITKGETRDLTTGSSGVNGAALVPQAFEGVLHDARKYYGPVSTLVGQKRTNNNGAPMKVSISDDTANALSVLGETVAVTEIDPADFVAELLATDTVTTGLVKVSMQELDDSYFDLDSWLRSKFGQRYGRGLEAYVTNGNSSNVSSLVSGATATTTAVGNGTAAGGTDSTTGVTGANSIGYDDIVALYGALDPAYVLNATWQMNSTTRAKLLGVKNTLGNPLFIPNPVSGAFDQLLGRPVVLNQALPNVAASAVGTVVFGDLQSGYLLRTDGDLAILRLNERFADSLEVGFIGFARIGGMTTLAKAIHVLTQAAS
jgi:HK97 family phage major capsid protein